MRRIWLGAALAAALGLSAGPAQANHTEGHASGQATKGQTTKGQARQGGVVEGQVLEVSPILKSIKLEDQNTHFIVSLAVKDQEAIYGAGGKTISLRDIKQGSKVRAAFNIADEKMVATRLDVLQPNATGGTGQSQVIEQPSKHKRARKGVKKGTAPHVSPPVDEGGL